MWRLIVAARRVVGTATYGILMMMFLLDARAAGGVKAALLVSQRHTF